MCVEHVREREAELAHDLEIALDLFEHGVDEHRLARLLVGEQIRIGRAFGVEELAKHHDGLQ